MEIKLTWGSQISPVNIDIGRETKALQEKIAYELTQAGIINQYFAIDDMQTGKTTGFFKQAYEHGLSILYAGPTNDIIDEQVDKLINEFRIPSDEIVFLKSYVKLIQDLPSYQQYNFTHEQLFYLKELEDKINILNEDMLGFKSIESYLHTEDEKVKKIFQELIHIIKHEYEKQSKNLDDKRIILLSNQRLFDKLINENLFGDRPKIFAYDESGIETYTLVPLEYKLLNKKLKKQVEFQLDKLDCEEMKYVILYIFNRYNRKIYDIKKYLDSQTKSKYQRRCKYKKKEVDNNEIKFSNDIKDDDSTLNKLLNELIGIMLFFNNKSIKSITQEENELIDYYNNSYGELELSLSNKITFLDKLYDEFIRFAFTQKNYLIKKDSNCKLSQLKKSSKALHNYISPKIIIDNKIFFNKFLKSRNLINQRESKNKFQLLTPVFQTFEKINQIAQKFSVMVLDATFSKGLFHQMRKYQFELPKFRAIPDEIQERNNFNNLQIKGVEIKNKEAIIINIHKYYNKQLWAGKTANVWNDDSYINGIKFTASNLVERYKKEVFALTHKSKINQFNPICPTISYPASGLNKYKDNLIQLIIGNKHFHPNTYLISQWIYNDCLPSELQDETIDVDFIASHIVSSQLYQGLGRIRPFTDCKVIVIFGQVPKRFEDKFTIIKPLNNIHIAILPFLIKKLLECKLDELLQFHCEDVNSDNLLALYFLQAINKIRIEDGEDIIRKPKYFSISKKRFVEEIVNLNMSNISLTLKKRLNKAMLPFIKFEKGREFRLQDYTKHNKLVWVK